MSETYLIVAHLLLIPLRKIVILNYKQVSAVTITNYCALYISVNFLIIDWSNTTVIVIALIFSVSKIYSLMYFNIAYTTRGKASPIDFYVCLFALLTVNLILLESLYG